MTTHNHTQTLPTIPTLPTIYVTEADHEILSNLADAVAGRAAGSRVLAGEMARAVIVEAGEAPCPFVGVGSTVNYQDLTSGQTRRVRLSLPRDASIDEGRISVLTPVGAALIGMTAGEIFHWTDSDGRQRGVRVLTIDV
ncbi:GreA/GreB family elongation factor [Caulobacter sp. ErkDOM-YI]|uniref:GreA/GreB family elongation factor n=1 Tax=unclassified Caulobacter TaxID=2648921 RepID=UPI003AF82173